MQLRWVKLKQEEADKSSFLVFPSKGYGPAHYKLQFYRPPTAIVNGKWIDVEIVD